MSGNKFQVALLTGVIVAGGAMLQTAVPRLAGDLDLMYLRAEYKLATGDAGSALKLMQLAANSSQTQETPAMAAAQPDASTGCPHHAPLTTKVAARRPSRMLRIEAAGHTFVVPTAGALKARVHAADWARIQAGEWPAREQYEQAMRLVEAKLRNIPAPPPAPAAPMPSN